MSTFIARFAIAMTLLVPVAPPNFAGHWVLDKSASDLGGSESGWFGNDVVITQNDKTITFAVTGTGPGTGSSTYQLDGTKNKTTMRGNTREHWAKWDANRLVLTSRSNWETPVPNRPPVTERTVTVQIDRQGALVVDVAIAPEMPASVGVFAKHTVYRKQPDR